MAQLITKFIANNAVDDTKIRLPSGNFLRARNQANTADLSILKTNGSDRIEFGSIPQYPASSPSPTLANDIVNKFYVDSAIAANVSKFYRTPVIVVDATDTTLPTGGTQVNGVTIPNGGRVLFTNLTTNNNYVYTAIVSGTITGWTIAADNNPSGAPTTGDTLWVQSGTYTKHQLTYNGTAFVVTGTDVGVEGGDSITVTSLGQINIALQTAGGLFSSSPGNPGGLLGIKLQATTPTLLIDGSNQLGVRFSTTTSALQTGANGLMVQVQATNPSLIIDGTNQLGVKFSTTTSALQTTASGLGVQLQATNPTLIIDGSNQLGVKFATATAGLQAVAGGLAILLESANPTLQISGSPGALGVKLDPARAVTTGANGIGINIATSGNISLSIVTNTLGVALNGSGALITTTTGLQVQVEATNPTLKINGSNQLAVNFSTTVSGLLQDSTGLRIKLQASNPTLTIDGSNQLGVLFSTSTSGLATSATGLTINLEASNPSLQVNGSNQLGVKFALASGLTTNTSGLLVLVDGTTDATTAIDATTGQLRTPRIRFEVITLTSTNITNQYVDLQRLTQLNSCDVVAYGVTQTSGVDFTLSTVGGVTRVTFAGDLATGGNAALVAGDILYVKYRSYTA